MSDDQAAAGELKNIGPFEVIEELGKGGFGTVYKGVDPELERYAAIKLLSPMVAADPGLVERFRHEARVAAALNHPNIVTIYSIGEHQGRPYIAMELLGGQDLSKLQGLEVPRIFRIVCQIADGLSYAHARGVVHRDIKPSNIRVIDDKHLKVLDFGLASLPSANLTKTGQIFGTLGYMSPEQLNDAKTADSRSDIFSLGVMFYELLGGRKPFTGDSDAEAMVHTVNTDPAPIAELAGGPYAALEPIVMRCLEKDPIARFQSCEDLTDALKEAMHYQASSYFSADDVEQATAGTDPLGVADEGNTVFDAAQPPASDVGRTLLDTPTDLLAGADDGPLDADQTETATLSESALNRAMAGASGQIYDGGADSTDPTLRMETSDVGHIVSPDVSREGASHDGDDLALRTVEAAEGQSEATGEHVIAPGGEGPHDPELTLDDTKLVGPDGDGGRPRSRAPLALAALAIVAVAAVAYFGQDKLRSLVGKDGDLPVVATTQTAGETGPGTSTDPVGDPPATKANGPDDLGSPPTPREQPPPPRARTDAPAAAPRATTKAPPTPPTKASAAPAPKASNTSRRAASGGATEVAALLAAGKAYAASNDWTRPAGACALDKYVAAARLDPTDPDAKEAVGSVFEFFLRRGDELAAEGKVEPARIRYAKARRILRGPCTELAVPKLDDRTARLEASLSKLP